MAGLSKEEYLRRMYLDPVPAQEQEGKRKKKKKQKQQKAKALQPAGIMIVDEDQLADAPFEQQAASSTEHTTRAQSDDDSETERRQRRKRVDSDDDSESERRQRRKRVESDDDSETERRQRRKRVDSDDDSETERRQRRKRVDSDDDSESGHRHKRRKRVDSDDDDASNSTAKQQQQQQEQAPAPSVLHGLSTGSAVRQLGEAKRAEEQRKFAAMTQEDMGKDAATVHRDRKGRRLETLDHFLKISNKASGQSAEDDEATRLEWGKGLVQQRDKEREQHERVAELAKPFARTRDDADLNRMQMDIDRWGDPMAGLVSKKKKKKSDGPSKPVYSGPPPPPNRFNIPPGHRWDGVDRSNGWEKKLFTIKAGKAAQSAAAYKWSVEDM